ncbi:MAG TPA: RidA family protein [Pyrinomonadaceae bacterium]
MNATDGSLWLFQVQPAKTCVDGIRQHLTPRAWPTYLLRMPITRIETPNAPKPAGHYSQGVVHNGLVFVSGQLAIDPKTGEKKLGSIGEQTEQALANVHGILQAAGSDWDKVLKMTLFVSDIDLWSAVNEVYIRVLGDNRPARAVIPCGPLHYGFLIEIEAIAAVGD